MSPDRVARAASAAEQLCGALWETLREQAEIGDARAVAELSRRLVEVCESFGAVASAGLETLTDADAAAEPSDANEQAETLGDLRRSDEEPAQRTAGPGEEGVVELAPAGPGPGANEVGAAEASDPARWSASAPAALVDEYEAGGAPIEAKDARAGGHPPVTAALRRRLERHDSDGVPFSVLLIEVLDVERLRALRATGDLLHEIWSVESAISEQLRPADTLLREIDGRWWLIAPDTDVASARQLAERLAGAARRFAHRGTPLRVVVGIAVCPDHGLDAASLIGHADVDLYAAQAAGRSVGGFDEDSSPV